MEGGRIDCLGGQLISQSQIEGAVPHLTDNKWFMQAELTPAKVVCFFHPASSPNSGFGLTASVPTGIVTQTQ
jgi:hypothetical protein